MSDMFTPGLLWQMYRRDDAQKKEDSSITVSAYTAMTTQHDGRKERGRKTDNDDIVIFQIRGIAVL